jgi:hypothetical protein
MKSRRFTADRAKLKKFLNIMLQAPKLRVPDAMKLANFSDEDIADLSLRCFLQHSLPWWDDQSNEGAPCWSPSAQTATI